MSGAEAGTDPGAAIPRGSRRRFHRIWLGAVTAQGLGLAAGLLSGPARAADYPDHPIRLVVPYPAGGPLDLVARSLAEALRPVLGQPLIVDNRPGAGGNLGAEIVARAPADGYTLLIGAVATHAINPHLYRRMPYDALRDFTPITRLADVPNVLVMNREAADRLGLHTVADLIRHARSRPGALNYASGGNGSAGHLAGELFKSMAGVRIVHIPYQGAGPAQFGLIAGQTDLMFDNLASATPQIRADRLRAFAVTTRARANAFPELPTLDEAGLKNFDISTWFGLFAPAQLAPGVVQRLDQAVQGALKTPALTDRLAGMGAVAAPLGPEAFARFVYEEHLRYQRIVSLSGARID